MNAPELLQNFNELLDSFETRRGYIDKAKTQAKKFKPEVIEKVVRDHEAKSTEISDRIIPLVPQLQSAHGRFQLRAQLGGTPRAIQLSGTGQIRDGLVRPINRSEVFQNLNANLHFDEKQITQLWEAGDA